MTVVDASVMVSLALRHDSNYLAARSWWALAGRSRLALNAPAILAPELGGAVGRVTGSVDAARGAVARVLRHPRFSLRAVDQALARAAAELAITNGLKGCDALYVALARDMGVPLVTFDREQAERTAGLVAVVVPASRP